MRVEPGETLVEGDLLPITVAVNERKHRSVSAGVSYKTDEGLGVKISWEHRNIFHEGERLTLSATTSDYTLAAEGAFRKPEFLRNDQSLLFNLRLALQLAPYYDTVETDYAFFKGRITSSGYLPVAMKSRLVLAGQVAVGAITGAVREAIAADELVIENRKSIRVEASGFLDLKAMESKGEFVVRCEDPQTIKAITDSRFAGQIALKGSFSGPLRQPLGNVLLQLREVDVGKVRAPTVKGRLQVGFLGPLESPFPGFRVSGTGNAQIITVGKSGVTVERGLNWALDVAVPPEELIRIDRLKLSGEMFSLELSGQVNPAGPTGKVAATAVVEDMRMLSPFIGTDVPAAVRLQTLIEGDVQSRSASAQIRGTINMHEHGDPSLEHFIDKEISYIGKVALKEGKQLTASGIRVGGVKWKLTGDACLDFAEETISGSLRLFVPQLARLSPAIGRSLAGSLQINGDIQGPWEKATLNVEAIGQGVELEGFAFENILAALRADGLPPRSTGNLQLKLNYGEQSLTGGTDFTMDESRLNLSALSAKAGQNELSGALALDFRKGLIEGDVEGNWGNLLDFSPFIKNKVRGSIAFQTRFGRPKPASRSSLLWREKTL